MKALLIPIDLMVRVCVPDDATEEQIISAAVDKAQELSSDRSWFGEGCGEFENDEEMPYGSSPNDRIPKASPEFIALAQHLVEMMVESDSDMHVAFQDAARELEIESYDQKLEDMDIGDIPDHVIKLTAFELECGFMNAEYEKTEGGYYYSGMTEDYGGLIEKAMTERAKEILTSNKTI